MIPLPVVLRQDWGLGDVSRSTSDGVWVPSGQQRKGKDECWRLQSIRLSRRRKALFNPHTPGLESTVCAWTIAAAAPKKKKRVRRAVLAMEGTM